MKNTSRKVLSLSFLMGLCVFFSHCSLFVPAETKDSPSAAGYQVTPPAGWRAVSAPQGEKAFSLPSGNAVSVTSSCTRNADAPLEVLTKHLLIGSRNVAIEKREKMEIDGADGLYSELTATLDGKPFHLEVFVLPKGGCVFDFSLISRSAISDAESNQFLTFIRSFHYESKR